MVDKIKCFYITRKAFRKLCLEVKTKNIKKLHNYFVEVDELFIEYTKYQFEYKILRSEYEKNLLNDKNNDLISKMDIILIENKNQSQQITAQSQQIANLLLRTNDIYNINIETTTKLISVEQQNSEIKQQNVETHEKLNILTNKTKNVVNEVEKIVSDIVPKIVNKQLQEHFIIMHDTNAIDTYYIIRTQHRNVTNSIKKLQLKIETLYKLFDTIDYSHPKNLYILLKNHIKK